MISERRSPALAASRDPSEIRGSCEVRTVWSTSSGTGLALVRGLRTLGISVRRFWPVVWFIQTRKDLKLP